MAYHLTRPGIADGKKVVVLEAKDVASGASECIDFKPFPSRQSL